MSIVQVVFDLDGCACVSATSIECGPPSFDRSNFFFSTCTLLQSRLTAETSEESRRREESAFVGIDGSIVGDVVDGTRENESIVNHNRS